MVFKMDRTIAPQNAAQKSITIKPVMILLTNISNKAFITNENRPSVKILIGNVINIRIGFINVLIIPMTKATKSAVGKLFTFIPGISQDTSITANADKIHFSIILSPI